VHADAPGALMNTPPEFPMKTTCLLAVLVFSLLATTAWAQSDSKPLNLNLPPTDLPTSAYGATSPAKGSSTSTAATRGTSDKGAPNTGPSSKDPPGTYYGDTSGRMTREDVADAAVDDCDDATYNKPQIHGSVSTGVVSSSRGGSGNYQAGTVNLSQAFGSCEHPTGGVSISVGSGTGHFHGRGR
jgi:hypothetical protein